jgi:DNA-binding response OmpR family regulator
MGNTTYIVEDDKDISKILSYNLEKEGFNVKVFEKGADLLMELKQNIPDLIILDIMLPDIDGFTLTKLIKYGPDTKYIPIIMLTAKDSEIDKVLGLELGADDYVTKPFSIKELIVRIKNLIQRYKIREQKNYIQIDTLKIYPESFKVEIDNKSIPLTTSEFKILVFLVKNPEKIFSRQYILENVLKSEADSTSRVVDVHIKKLRDKLGKYGKYIKTVRGQGYKFTQNNNN